MLMDFAKQNILLILTMIASGAALLWGFRKKQENYLSPQAATLRINREDAAILDIRSVDDFNKGHLLGAVNIPLDELGGKTSTLDKVKPLIVCCASGLRSEKALETLKKDGFGNIFNLDGGVDAWVSAGFPLQKEKGKKK